MAEKPIVVAATRWKTAVFGGLRVAVSGFTLGPETELEIKGLLVADIQPTDRSGRAEILLVDDRDDGPLDMHVALGRLVHALEVAHA